MNIDLWTIAAIPAGFLLAAYARSRNAVWGAALLGFVVGLVYACAVGFEWPRVWHVVIVFVYLGFAIELPRTLARLKA